jgi:acetyl-CoA synthetase
MDDKHNEIEEQQSCWYLCIKFHGPIAELFGRRHQRYKDTYFLLFPVYFFTGDGALRDEVVIIELLEE